ncbi:phage gp6-like head-tail connector protein [Fictibacillus phosphorivorans]|uniref:phage gp6-like head-tail connector protein n=1 Tax=Fictibacillus phosphorivorans TaxID=1221500 RepID=UPI003CE8BA5A
MTDTEYVAKLKNHIQWEEGMDETMLPFYIKSAQKYVQTATGKQDEYLVLMVAGIMNDYRVSEKELEQALDALTPFFVLEVYNDVETTNE